MRKNLATSQFVKKSVVCIPGLGGHRSVFEGYDSMIPDYRFRYIEVVDWQKAEEKLKNIIREEGRVILLCHCYGAQLALRCIAEMPSSVFRLIIIEPFFAQFYWWRGLMRVINLVFLALLKVTDYFGFRRKTFPYQINYFKLSRFPMFFQPFFDIRWQSLTDYFSKIDDILAFQLPPRTTTQTLFVFSPHGYFTSPQRRKELFDNFAHYDSVEVGENTHNIITVSREKVAGAIRQWLIKNNEL